MKFVCVGHSTYDTTILMDSYPIENYKYRVPKKVECEGGPAANAAYLLSKWGEEDVCLVSVVGNDYYGGKIIKEFNNIGVDTTYIEKNSDIETDSSYIISNTENGSRTILVATNNNLTSLKDNVDIRDANVILVDGEYYETAKEILINNMDALSIMDAGRCTEEVINLGKLVDYFICSKDFAEEFTKMKIDFSNNQSLIDIYEILNSNFKGQIIITLEKYGSFTKIDDTYKIIPSLNVKSIDTTGAGDIFHGAFTYFINNNNSLEQAIILSSIAAAISTTKVGSRYSIPTLEEVMQIYGKNEII